MDLFWRSVLCFISNNERFFKFERDIVETKDLLKSLTMKLDSHIEETNERFKDFESAIAEIENNFFPNDNINSEEMLTLTNETHKNEPENGEILSVDLKNIIKNELANVNVN